MGSAVLFEEHGSVLAHWHGRGVRGATLVCLDAHLDLQFVEQAKIDRLARCADAQDVLALESPHPLDPARDACFGIEDFLYPAARLGIVRQLVWVAPPHVLEAGFSMALFTLGQMEGVTIEQLESFRHTPGGWLEGELLGLPMVIGSLARLTALEPAQPVLLDIDADYFAEVPQDRLWCSPVATCLALRSWLGGEHELTIARSASTGFLPPALAGIPEVLAACWTGRAEEALHLEAQLAAAGSAPGGGAAGDADMLTAIGSVRARGQSVTLAQVKAMQRRLERWEGPPRRIAAAWVALGLLCVQFGREREAIDCHRRAAGEDAGHPELALEIGKLLLAGGSPGAAQPWLVRAAQDDETRVQAWLLLADGALQRRDAAAAARHAADASRAAPAWTAPWSRLAAAAAARGDHKGEKTARAAWLALEQRLEAVAQRLGSAGRGPDG